MPFINERPSDWNVHDRFDFEVESEMFSFKQFNFDRGSDEYTMGFESEDGGNIVKQTHLYGTKVWEETGHIDLFPSDLSFYKEKITQEGLFSPEYTHDQQLWDFGIIDDPYLDNVSTPFQLCQDEITKVASVQTENSEPAKSNSEKPSAFPLASLGLLKNHVSGVRRLKEGKVMVPACDAACSMLGIEKLSTEAIIRLAGEQFIQASSQKGDNLFMLSHPYGCSFVGLSDQEARDVDLVQCLLASAEKVGQQQFDRASKLLNLCDYLSSNTGNPIQRVVYYFSEALREKIGRETGRIRSKGLGKKQSRELEEAMMSPNLTIFALSQKVPFFQISQFAGMQSVVENIVEAKRVHIIDLEIRSGMHCTVLMQALAARCECPVELLKISAIGTKSKPRIEETGKWLTSFAESINLPFSFHVIMVSDMLDLNEDLFELDAGEAVVVYSQFVLRTMIVQPDRLEWLMGVMRNVNPCIMVVAEVEANHNSPVFVNRFLEALFFYGAFFDCLEDCMPQDQHRMIAESYFFLALGNIVAAEGEERTFRHVNMNVWRAFFARFGMTEIKLSESSLYQASLLVMDYACGSACTLDMDEKCLITGWKGTPICSLSAWKFL